MKPDLQRLIEAILRKPQPHKHYSGDVMGMSGHYEVGYTGLKCDFCGEEDYHYNATEENFRHKLDCSYQMAKEMRTLSQ